MRPHLLIAALLATPCFAQTNAGNLPASNGQPFTATPITSFDEPWKLGFLPDGRMLITERAGALWLVTQQGRKAPVRGVPKVVFANQSGLLGVFVSPTFRADRRVYLTYSEPGAGGSGLALARATLVTGGAEGRLDGLQVIWRELPKGKGGQFGADLAFAPDGKTMYLSSGERMRMTPAQDSDQALGKILRLTLDGKPAPGNPGAGKTGAAGVTLIAPPKNTEAAKTAPGRTVAVQGPNLVPSEVWSSGHRNPYGLAFDAKGQLWETEMGPRGGDELNLIQPGKNYGWPLVSYGMNYDGVPIPNPDTRPDLARPAVYWTPVIAPAGFTFYQSGLFPAWKGSAFIGGLACQCLVRIAFDGPPRQADRWDMGERIRDVVSGPDGALWVLEDGGRLLRLTPKR